MISKVLHGLVHHYLPNPNSHFSPHSLSFIISTWASSLFHQQASALARPTALNTLSQISLTSPSSLPKFTLSRPHYLKMSSPLTSYFTLYSSSTFYSFVHRNYHKHTVYIINLFIVITTLQLHQLL